MTKGYNLLFSVTLQHAYYASGTAQDLVLEPVGPTAAFMRRNDVHAKMDGANLIVFYGKEAGLAPALAYLQGRNSLFFALRSQNPYFFNITDIPFFHSQTHRLYATNISKTPDSSGTTSLTLTDFAGEADLLPNTAPVFKELQIPDTILGLVEIAIGRQAGLVPLPSADPQANPVEVSRFNLTFESRKANWRYLVVNKSQLKIEQMEVLDGRTQLSFQQGTPRLLHGTDHLALPLSSVSTYAIQERSPLRPKLKISSAEGSSISRTASTMIDLPTPDWRRIVPEMVDGKQLVFADMYVFL